MRDEQWEKVRELLRFDSSYYCSQVDENGLSVLAIAASSFAPLDIVDSIIKSHPESTSLTDEYGATPLHFACLNGTTPDVVRLFLQHDLNSIKIVDNSNYSVLHHAVEYVCLLIENRHRSKSSGDGSTIGTEFSDYLEIIKLLCKAAPEMVHCVTNDNNDTPLDIPQSVLTSYTSIDKNTPIVKSLMNVYRILKTTSIHVYRENKKLWEDTFDQSILKKSSQDLSSAPSMNPSDISTNGGSTIGGSISLNSNIRSTGSNEPQNHMLM